MAPIETDPLPENLIILADVAVIPYQEAPVACLPSFGIRRICVAAGHIESA